MSIRVHLTLSHGEENICRALVVQTKTISRYNFGDVGNYRGKQVSSVIFGTTIFNNQNDVPLFECKNIISFIY